MPGICAFHHILGTLFQFLLVFKLHAGLSYGLLYINREGIKIPLHFLIKIACHVISPQELACAGTPWAIPKKQKNGDLDRQAKEKPVAAKESCGRWGKQAGIRPCAKPETAHLLGTRGFGKKTHGYFSFPFIQFLGKTFFRKGESFFGLPHRYENGHALYSS